MKNVPGAGANCRLNVTVAASRPASGTLCKTCLGNGVPESASIFVEFALSRRPVPKPTHTGTGTVTPERDTGTVIATSGSVGEAQAALRSETGGV